MPDLIAPSISGADELVKWFGSWPSFHDAEVLEVCLRREGKSCLRIHAWRITKEVDPAAHFVRDHHVVVSFWFDRVLDLELADFSQQNVIFGLGCEAKDKGVRVTLSPCFGVAGYIEAESVSVSFEPGEPAERH